MARRRHDPRFGPPPLALTPPPSPAADGAHWPPPDPALRGRSRKLIGQVSPEVDATLLIQDWPEQLVRLTELTEAALRHHMAEHPEQCDPATLARVVTVAQADYFGGTRMWWPRTVRVRQLLRDLQIYRAFDGRNQGALARKFRLSTSAVTRAIKRQIELRRRRAAAARRALTP